MGAQKSSSQSFKTQYSLDILGINWWKRHCEHVVRLSIDVQLGFLNQDEWCSPGHQPMSRPTIHALLAGYLELIGGVVP